MDERNAIVGLLMTTLPETPQKVEVRGELSQIQSDLFHVERKWETNGFVVS